MPLRVSVPLAPVTTDAPLVAVEPPNASEAIVLLKPLKSSVAVVPAPVPLTITAVLGNALLIPSLSVPPLTVVVPV